MTHDQSADDTCCPVFDPEPWDHKTWEWQDKLFLKDSVREFFHMPLPSSVGKVMTRMWKVARDADAAPEIKDFLVLANDPTPFRGDFYLLLTKEIPGANMVRLSGTYYSMVFDGPYNAVLKWVKELNAKGAEKGLRFIDYYFYYTTCPKCAKKYGHNYVVAFGKVK
ncbi:MAG: hydrolase [Bacteroidota bacterium]